MENYDLNSPAERIIAAHRKPMSSLFGPRTNNKNKTKNESARVRRESDEK